MIKKEDLIPFCRYYKGEKECTYKEGNSVLFRGWEKKWIVFSLSAYSDEQEDLLGTMIDEYVAVGLRKFNQLDGTPVSLKALLFNRYLHHSDLPMKDGVEPLKIFYINTYKKSSHNYSKPLSL